MAKSGVLVYAAASIISSTKSLSVDWEAIKCLVLSDAFIETRCMVSVIRPLRREVPGTDLAHSQTCRVRHLHCMHTKNILHKQSTDNPDQVTVSSRHAGSAGVRSEDVLLASTFVFPNIVCGCHRLINGHGLAMQLHHLHAGDKMCRMHKNVHL